METNNIAGHRVVQIAYHVPDIKVAAHRFSEQTGAGPFFVSPEIKLSAGLHRGEDCLFVHSSAYGQWGEVMVEFVQQDSVGPSPFRDLYEPNQRGLHHLAVMTDDLPKSYEHFRGHGVELATQAWTLSGVEFAFLDALSTLGHFIEIYEATPQLLGFYQRVRTLSKDWNGRVPLRNVADLGKDAGSDQHEAADDRSP